MARWLALRSRVRGTVLGNDLDLADDVVVERCKFFGRDPVLLNVAAADRLDRIRYEEAGPHPEAGDIADVSRCGIFGVPVAGDLRRVCLVQHRVEDGLVQ